MRIISDLKKTSVSAPLTFGKAYISMPCCAWYALVQREGNSHILQAGEHLHAMNCGLLRSNSSFLTDAVYCRCIQLFVSRRELILLGNLLRTWHNEMMRVQGRLYIQCRSRCSMENAVSLWCIQVRIACSCPDVHACVHVLRGHSKCRRLHVFKVGTLHIYKPLGVVH